MFQTGAIAAKPAGMNAGNQGDMLRQAYANRGTPSGPDNFATPMAQQAPATPQTRQQMAIEQVTQQTGYSPDQIRSMQMNWQLNQPAAMPPRQIAAPIQAAPLMAVRAPAPAAQTRPTISQAFDQFRAGTYQAQPNTFTFQQKPQTYGMMGGIGSATAELQAMFGGSGQGNIGSLLAGLFGWQQPQRPTRLQRQQMAMQRRSSRRRLF